MADGISIVCSIISACCAFGSLLTAIVIGGCQVKQGQEMAALALRQDNEAKRQKERRLKAQRDAFLMKYFNEKDDIYLLPLCWISAVYNPVLAYHRNMFREYNMLEEDVQDAICHYMNFKLDKPKTKGLDFYFLCLDTIQKVEWKYWPKERNRYTGLFRNGGRYLFKCLEEYRAKDTPWRSSDLEYYLYDCLYKYDYLYKDDRDQAKSSNPLESYTKHFEFNEIGNSDLNACEVCAVAANALAQWEGKKNSHQNGAVASGSNEENRYWIPGKYGNENLETMEDLFLCALFSIYVNLILPKNNEE